MVCYNPYITGWYNPLYNLTNQFFFHCSYDQKLDLLGVGSDGGREKTVRRSGLVNIALFATKNVLFISPRGGSLHVCHFCSFILLRLVNSYYPVLRTLSYNHLLNSLLKNTQAHPRSGGTH